MKKTTVCNDAIPLPVPANPHKTICVQLEIPNSLGHIAAFMGALHNLGVNKSWERDVGHNAIEVSRLWKQAYETVRFGCDTKPDVVYAALEDDMPFFREVCENDKCYLEYQCCPGEWVRLANADQLTLPTSLGEHQEQPPSGGGTAKYCVSMLANGKLPLPTTVNTGDVITLNSASGNANDGTEVNFRCPDGNIYYGGVCSSGTGYLQAGDPIAHNHMSVVFSINGTFYAFTSGTFTVPGGISNGQVLLQVNDANLTDNSGSYDVCVTVKNNQATSWCNLWNLALTDGGWSINPTECGHWNPGIGWVSDPCPGAQNLTVHYEFMSAPTLTDFEVVFSGAGAGNWQIFIYDFNTATNLGVDSGSLPSGNISHVYSHIGAVIPGHHIWIVAYLDNAGGAVVNSTVKGTGSNPFGSSNC